MPAARSFSSRAIPQARDSDGKSVLASQTMCNSFELMAIVPGTPLSTFMNLLRIKRQLGKQWASGITEEREWEETAFILIVRL